GERTYRAGAKVHDRDRRGRNRRRCAVARDRDARAVRTDSDEAAYSVAPDDVSTPWVPNVCVPLRRRGHQLSVRRKRGVRLPLALAQRVLAPPDRPPRGRVDEQERLGDRRERRGRGRGKRYRHPAPAGRQGERGGRGQHGWNEAWPRTEPPRRSPVDVDRLQV